MKKKLHKLQLSALLAGLVAAAPAQAAQSNEGRERLHAAMQDCRGELGLPAPVTGQHMKLSADQMSELKDCLGRQGVEMPKHHRRFAREEMESCFARLGVAMPKRDPASNERPALDDAQKAALQDCRQTIRVQFRGNS